MRKSIKLVGVAASLALGLLPVMAAAQIHSHPSRQTLTDKAQASRNNNTAFQATYSPARPEQPAQPSCGSNCQPMQMYGIGY
jgi:hypothetical protein